MGIVRAEVIAKMRGAFRKGLSGSTFIADMRAAGLGYRRTDMLADWRTVNQLEKKKGAIKYVRRDRYPTEKVIAAVEWDMDKDFMYTVQVRSRLRPDEPVTERFVNITSDVPLTPAMIESQVHESWTMWEKYAAEMIVGLQVWSAARLVPI